MVIVTFEQGRSFGSNHSLGSTRKGGSSLQGCGGLVSTGIHEAAASVLPGGPKQRRATQNADSHVTVGSCASLLGPVLVAVSDSDGG